MKIFALFNMFVLFNFQLFAQVKIGDNHETINSSAILELESTTKGLLFPRVALVATDNFSPLAEHKQGMVVYNTATAGSGATAVTPGLYYNTGTVWEKANGTDGNTVLNGSADPSSEGDDGDFYINTTENTIFGPKTSGSWGSSTSLTGGNTLSTTLNLSPTYQVVPNVDINSIYAFRMTFSDGDVITFLVSGGENSGNNYLTSLGSTIPVSETASKEVRGSFLVFRWNSSTGDFEIQYFITENNVLIEYKKIF